MKTLYASGHEFNFPNKYADVVEIKEADRYRNDDGTVVWQYVFITGGQVFNGSADSKAEMIDCIKWVADDPNGDEDAITGGMVHARQDRNGNRF